MNRLRKSIANASLWSAVFWISFGGAAASTARADEWQVKVGAEAPDMGPQALAFLPNELWIHAGDTVRFVFTTHERHTATFLKPGQVRPPNFGPVFGIEVGCPGSTPDGASFDGSSCVNSNILLLNETSGPGPLTYSVFFPSPGNFKMVCLVHPDMTGVVHVVDPTAALPHDHDFYEDEGKKVEGLLLADAAQLKGEINHGDDERWQSGPVAAGVGQVVTTTGAGSQTASLMRFVREIVVARVGDTVEWTSLDPSINHTVTFGTEPDDPRPALNATTTSDGARQAIISSPSDSVNSGFLSPAPQDRANLAQSNPGVTRFRVTFMAPGVFHYICAIHDEEGMKGTVIVHP